MSPPEDFEATLCRWDEASTRFQALDDEGLRDLIYDRYRKSDPTQFLGERIAEAVAYYLDI